MQAQMFEALSESGPLIWKDTNATCECKQEITSHIMECPQLGLFVFAMY